MRRALLASALLWGCAAPQRAPICFSSTALHKQAHVEPSEWFHLMLYGYNAGRNEVPRPTLACEGTPVVLQAADTRCGEPAPNAEPLPAVPLSESDVVVGKAPNQRQLVWVITRRFFNGEAIGPVALVEPQEKGLAVRALGTLRSLFQRSSLRLETVGGVALLVAEGEACAPDAPINCRRAARLVPLRNDRFISEPLTFQDGSCAGPAWVNLRRDLSAPRPGGGVRKAELTSVLHFGPEVVTVEEQVTVKDFEPKQPATPAAVHHNAEGRREIRPQGRSLQVDHPSLWTRLVEAP